jgi:putative DNA primase/helicase
MRTKDKRPQAGNGKLIDPGKIVKDAATSTETDEERFERLAKITPAEYDRARSDEAEKAGVRIGTLDCEVQKRREKDLAAAAVQAAKVQFENVEPWADPVDGAAFLDEIAGILKRFVIVPELAIIAASLFILHTFAFDLGDISPILFITGPTKRCGKTKFLAILARLVWRAFTAASATAAGIYRLIELHHPTLCIDEVDAFVRGDGLAVGRGRAACRHRRYYVGRGIYQGSRR